MEIEIISREVIKPSKPTPPHCKTYNISILDQWLPGFYVPVLFLYQSPKSIPEDNYINDNLAKHLKSSLSDVLAYYYPFAGRVKDIVSIDCNDDGVLFLEAHVKNKLKLADILAQPLAIEPPSVNIFFPDNLQWKIPENNDTLLAVQLSRFDCGGFSIGICLSHKIADACTISNFLNDWAALARQSDSTINGPLLNASSIFPPDDKFPFLPTPEMSESIAQGQKFMTRRFLFPCTKISELKTIIAADGYCNPTRVEAVNSALFRSIVKGWKKSSPCVFPQAIDMRSRMATKLPTNTMGNFVWNFMVTINNEENDGNYDVSLSAFVENIRNELKKSCEFAQNTEAKDWISTSMESFIQVMMNYPTSCFCTVSSWCRYPLYKTNFGLGDPIWASTISIPYRNNFLLLDAKDGQSIEAWVTLDAQLMAAIEGDEELLKFSLLNPGIALHDSCEI